MEFQVNFFGIVQDILNIFRLLTTGVILALKMISTEFMLSYQNKAYEV